MTTGTRPTDRFEDRLLAAILDDYDQLTGPAAPDPLAGVTGRPRPVRRAAPAVVATAAAAAVAVTGVVVSGPGRGGHTGATTATTPAPPAASAHLVLYRLAAASASAPATDGPYVVLSETDTETDEPGQSRRTTVVDTRTGASTTYQVPYQGNPAPSVLTTGPDATSTEAWFAALPTDTAALRARLLAVARQQEPPTTGSSATAGAPAPTAAYQPTADDLVYQEADQLLWSPLVQPALRAALYRVLATTSGVAVDTHATDPAGRPAISMTRTYSGITETDVTYENPATGAVLAQVWKDPGLTIAAVYQPVTSAASIPPDPYAG